MLCASSTLLPLSGSMVGCWSSSSGAVGGGDGVGRSTEDGVVGDEGGEEGRERDER